MECSSCHSVDPYGECALCLQPICAPNSECHRAHRCCVRYHGPSSSIGCAVCAPPLEPSAAELAAQYSRFVRNLGSGTFGRVDLMEDPATGTRVAVKYAKRELGDLDRNFPNVEIREISVLATMRRLENPYVIRMLGFDLGDPLRGSGSRIWLELGVGNLEDKIRYYKGTRIPFLHAVAYSYELARGMAILNRAGIMHRDLKPDNILLDRENHIRIADFGWARAGPFVYSPITGPAYTLPFRPPEILHQELTGERPFRYGIPADVYAMGVIVMMLFVPWEKQKGFWLGASTPAEHYLMLIWFFGRHRMGIQAAQRMEITLTGKLSSPLREKVHDTLFPRYRPDPRKILRAQGANSEVAIDYVLDLLEPDPRLRSTHEELLAHPLFDSVRGWYPPLNLPPPLSTQSIPIPGSASIPQGTMMMYYQRTSADIVYLSLYTWKSPYSVASLALHLWRCMIIRQPQKNQEKPLLWATACLYIAGLYHTGFYHTMDDARIPAKVEQLTRTSRLGRYPVYAILETANEVFVEVGAMMHLPTLATVIMEDMDESDIAQDTMLIMGVLEASSLGWIECPSELAQITAAMLEFPRENALTEDQDGALRESMDQMRYSSPLLVEHFEDAVPFYLQSQAKRQK